MNVQNDTRDTGFTYDVCIIGSGAGAGPIAYELSRAGYQTLILEKGKWFTESDFSKDEISCCRRDVYTPSLDEEFHEVVSPNVDGTWSNDSSREGATSFWNGNCVGGSSNFMSGYFHRLKPLDFRLASEFGTIPGANVVDWPITYEELEPYYAKVEQIVGVSGKVVPHSFLEPRSTTDYPYPPLAENIAASLVDDAANALGFETIPVPRAILSQPKARRQACYYSGYCGSYGCNSGAKGSSRAALLDDAYATGNCKIFPESMVTRLHTGKKNRIQAAEYVDSKGRRQMARARIFVVACQAIETARLLLLSANEQNPDGLGNRSGLLGRNLVFSAGGSGTAEFHYADYPDALAAQLRTPGLFMNRAIQQFYVINDSSFGPRAKGGTIDFLFEHANPIRRANQVKWQGSRLRWGRDLQDTLFEEFTTKRHFRFEVFNDWLPTDECFVSLSSQKDRWGAPVAKVKVGYHPHDLKVAQYLMNKGESVARGMNLHNIDASVSGDPPPNLIAGGCRFGSDPSSSYLDPDCRSHYVSNLFVTDGSFMPTGGSVPYTWTIYANSFRVAEKIIDQL